MKYKNSLASSWIIFAILSMFFLKTFILAFFITPIWDIPDETTHYAYISDLVNGKGIPLIGKSTVESKIVNSWYKKDVTTKEFLWAAQHPPGYYILGAIPLKIATLFTNSDNILFLIPRIINVIVGTLCLLIYYKICLELTDNKLFAITTMSLISFIPMYSNISGGTNNDMLLCLFIGLSIMYWFRYLNLYKIKDGLLMSIFLSLAGFVKLTSLPIALAIILSSFLFSKESLIERIKKTTVISIISSIFPVIWIARNIYYYGTFLLDSANFEPDINPYHTSLLSFVSSQPVIEHTFMNFFAIFGWYGKGTLQSLGLTDIFLLIYSIICCSFGILSFLWYCKYFYKKKSKWTNIILIGGVLISLIAFFIIFPDVFIIRRILFSFIFGILFFSIVLLLPSVGQDNNIIFGSIVVITAFLASFLIKLSELYNQYGYLIATHGRYWFPIIPLLIVVFFYPSIKLVNIKPWILYLLILVVSLTELMFYLTKVIPFYQGVI